MKKDAMGGVCSRYGADEECVNLYFSEGLKVRYNSEELCVNGRLI
jgi:hypothetical protein